MKAPIKKILNTLVLSASLLCVSQSANAGLIARTFTDATFGTVDAYYDDVLKITWLKDANFAKTSGYDADGRMTWFTALVWAESLFIGGVGGWRLPSVQALNGQSFNYNRTYDGSSDFGYNITSSMNEMAYMFNVNLGLGGYCDTATSTATTCGNEGGSQWHNTAWNRVIDTANLGNNIDIDNLMSYVYWSERGFGQSANSAWAFTTLEGYQDYYGKSSSIYGWAVRDGDVGAPLPPTTSVPEPTTLAIFGLGLLGLVLRRKSA